MTTKTLRWLLMVGLLDGKVSHRSLEAEFKKLVTRVPGFPHDTYRLTTKGLLVLVDRLIPEEADDA